jgi:hypothetical protein
MACQPSKKGPPSPLCSHARACPACCRYGFNSGSTQCVYGCMQTAAQIAVNTTLATGVRSTTGVCSAQEALHCVPLWRCYALLPSVLLPTTL